MEGQVPGYGKTVEREKKMEHGRAQARLSDDDMLRTGYVGETPLEGGKIADSEPVDLFNVQPQQQQQAIRGEEEDEGDEKEPSAPRGVQPAKQGMHGGRQLGRQ